MKLSKFVNFFHKASSYATVAAGAIIAVDKQISGISTVEGLVLVIAGVLSALSAGGNVTKLDKPE